MFIPNNFISLECLNKCQNIHVPQQKSLTGCQFQWQTMYAAPAEKQVNQFLPHSLDQLMEVLGAINVSIGLHISSQFGSQLTGPDLILEDQNDEVLPPFYSFIICHPELFHAPLGFQEISVKIYTLQLRVLHALTVKNIRDICYKPLDLLLPFPKHNLAFIGQKKGIT